ncbi:MAG: hypothetical protein HRT71_03270 [Flavobacteriales bacterium]|nr:hypothetical protein [Flavobacteriales bacterium]
MKKYTDEELADLVNQKIKAKFNSPESIIAEFESKLNGKVKSISFRKLTDSEIEDNVLKLAVDVHQNLGSISTAIIASKLSSELKDKSSKQGIELSEYDQTFNDLASVIVKGLIKKRYAETKKQNKKK